MKDINMCWKRNMRR